MDKRCPCRMLCQVLVCTAASRYDYTWCYANIGTCMYVQSRTCLAVAIKILKKVQRFLEFIVVHM